MSQPGNIEQAMALVREHLDRHQPANYRLQLVSESSRVEDDWFYVCVRPDQSNIRAYDYYDVLAQVEREIEDEHPDVNILLVPVAAEAA